jgi:glycine oxidase
VVVIGGGIIGLAVTDELTRRGVRVELLERSAELGQESSSAAAGILAPQSEAEGPGPFLQLLLSAAQMIPEAISRLETLTGISIGHRVSGMLTLAFSDSDQRELEEGLEWQHQAGLAPERLHPPAARRMEPSLDGPLQAAVYWPQTAVLDPRQFVRAYARAVEAQGASVRLKTAALRVVVRGGRAAGVETAAGPIESDWVVHCAGPWAGEEIGLPFALPGIPARGQILQFSTRAPLLRRVVKSPRAYLVQRTDGCLIAGTTLEYAGFEKRTTEEGIRQIREGVKEISGGAGRLPVESAWAGLRPDTPDHLPVLGPTPLKGFLAACGHFRNGILLAPLTGRLIADSILGVRPSLGLGPFGISRFVEEDRQGKIES